MEPTPFAEQLAEPVAYALGTLHSALNLCASFDPAKHACLRARDDGHRGDLFPAAPHGTAGTHRTRGVDKHGAKCDREPEEDMEAGRVDLALGLIPDLKAGFFQRRLFRH